MAVKQVLRIGQHVRRMIDNDNWMAGTIAGVSSGQCRVVWASLGNAQLPNGIQMPSVSGHVPMQDFSFEFNELLNEWFLKEA